MAKLTIGFGVLLLILGLWGYVGTGAVHPTALIPTYWGLALGVCGIVARTEDAKRRMVWMHIAVTVALLGFLGAGSQAVIETVKAHGGPLAHPEAVYSQIAMAAICAVFVGLCVRSFVAARKARTAEA